MPSAVAKGAQRERREEGLVPQPRRPATPIGDAPFGALSYLSYLALIYFAAVGLAVYRNNFTPQVIPAHAPSNLFSEGRVLSHVKAITDFGVRVVGTPEIDESAKYLLEEGHKLASHADKTRPDLLVQVFQEWYSGATAMPFLNREFINMYNNVTNIILVISPKTALQGKAVLVNAHFDSALGSPGASDDAASVGIMLEIARLLIEDKTRELAAPVVFLMNGAEEALCVAAHAFMTQSPWAKNLGVFLNLESTGNQGPDFLFQQTGNWPINTFVRAAPHPRGSVVAQDIFQLGLIPADTDYRFFSAKMQGSLPGLDIASLLGAGAYHTDRDSVENIREGTLQAMGENALAFVIEAGKDLALREHKGIDETDMEKSVFFDVLGMFMVTYPFKVARLVHTAPLIIVLSLPFLQRDAFSGLSSTKLFGQIFLEGGRSLLSFVLTIVCCILMGVFRVTLLQSPMTWHGFPFLAYCFLVPASLAGSLVPYLGQTISDPRIPAIGNLIALSIFSAVTVYSGIGMGFLTTIWTIAGLLALSDLKRSPKLLLKTATLHAIFPIIIFLPNALNLSLYILQKANLLGAHGQPDLTPYIVDGVAGAVIGLSSLSVIGTLPPWIAYAAGRNGLRRTVLGLLTVSALFAAIVTFNGRAYTREIPKKVLVQHIHRVTQDRILDSVLAVGSVDSVSIHGLLGRQRVQEYVDEGSGEGFKSSEDLYVDAFKTGNEWLTLYPFSEDFVEGVVLQDEVQHTESAPPVLELVKESEGSENTRRFLFQLKFNSRPYVGAMNLTGQIVDWSLPALSTIQSQTVQNRYVRFCGKGSDKDWQFWVEVSPSSSLSVQLSAAQHRDDAEIQKLISKWPAWVFPIRITAFSSRYDFQ